MASVATRYLTSDRFATLLNSTVRCIKTMLYMFTHDLQLVSRLPLIVNSNYLHAFSVLAIGVVICLHTLLVANSFFLLSLCVSFGLKDKIFQYGVVFIHAELQ